MALLLALEVALRCPVCRSLHIRPMNLFSLSGGRSFEITCCQQKLVRVSRLPRRGLRLHAPCSICPHRHFVMLPSRILQAGTVKTLICPETDVEIGFVGALGSVRDAVETWEYELARVEQEYNEHAIMEQHVISPGTMSAILGMLYRLAPGAKLSSLSGNLSAKLTDFDS